MSATLSFQAPAQAAEEAARTSARRPVRRLGNQALLRQLAASGPRVQPKLEIGPVDDPLEREADAVAEKVMAMPAERAGELTPAPPKLSRKCAACEDEDKAGGLLQAKPEGGALGGEAPSSVEQTLAGEGRPLEASARAFFEPRLGRDLSAVRVHDDEQAAGSAAAVGAQAYTVGAHIAFARGRYQPGADVGRRLIAHELAHTIQQGAVVRRKVTTPSPKAATQVASHINNFCSGAVTVNGSNVEALAGFCPKAGPGCECACAATEDKVRTFHIMPQLARVNWVNKALSKGGPAVSVPQPTIWPGTDASNPNFVLITIPEWGSQAEWGAFKTDDKPFWQKDFRILGHELCGHGVLKQGYPGQKRGNRPDHDKTIATENDVAGPIDGEVRGNFALNGKGRQGESFSNPFGDHSKLLFELQDGLHYEAVP